MAVSSRPPHNSDVKTLFDWLDLESYQQKPMTNNNSRKDADKGIINEAFQETEDKMKES